MSLPLYRNATSLPRNMDYSAADKDSSRFPLSPVSTTPPSTFHTLPPLSSCLFLSFLPPAWLVLTHAKWKRGEWAEVEMLLPYFVCLLFMRGNGGRETDARGLRGNGKAWFSAFRWER